ncbi:MAG: AAA family ATPase [Candidatus Peribacteria bacterium]|nr:MAG: AAA family ATPase [Candidatus Peribacteria bacterium]
MAGKPGIGKSTLVLQILSLVSKNNDVKLAYFSAEESSTQIQERFMRLFPNQELVCDIFHSNDIEDIVATAANYDLIIIDSIQTISSNTVDGIAGSPSQVKQCSEQLIETCKKNNIAAIIIGHVTKGGEIA